MKDNPLPGVRNIFERDGFDIDLMTKKGYGGLIEQIENCKYPEKYCELFIRAKMEPTNFMALVWAEENKDDYFAKLIIKKIDSFSE